MCCSATILALAPALAGCADISANPLEWWNALQGGAIAEQRPPPPGATDPYLPVEVIPARPSPIDPVVKARIAASLASDQAVAEEIGAEDPLRVKTQANPAPGQAPGPLVAHPATLPKPPDLPPSDPNAATASLQAADTPPPAAPPAPVPPASAAPAPPASAAPAKPAAAAPTTAQAGPLQPIPPAALPAIPTAPPALPKGLPEDFTIPAPPPDVSRLVSKPVPGIDENVAFRTGVASLTAVGVGAIRSVVPNRATHDVRVIGRGEASSYDPAEQAKALRLALERADAMATVLRQAGVPASAIRISADPFGRGGAVRLILSPTD